MNIEKVLCNLIILIFISCSNSNESENKNSISKYIISEAEMNRPIDLNFDDNENINLLHELSAFTSIVMYIEKKEHNPIIEIIWLEPRINGILLKELPEIYDSTMDIEYFPVSNQYYYTFSEDGKSIKINENDKVVVDNSVYTFLFPKILVIQNNTIKFETTQRFLTKRGIEERIIKVIFIAASEEDIL